MENIVSDIFARKDDSSDNQAGRSGVNPTKIKVVGVGGGGNLVRIEHRGPSPVVTVRSVWPHIVVQKVALLAEYVCEIHIFSCGERLQIFVIAYK